jgi:DNA-binding HxlR family transcriptional regulator
VRTYGQYCPIARASEILAERWTPIIVRNLLAGCTTYSQISAGAPGLSRSLLTQRLRLLERVGVVEVRPKPRGRGVVYQLSDAGRDLRDVMSALGTWGERWLELGDEHTNPRLVLWAWCTAYLDRERLPDRRVVVRFEFSDQPADNRRVWLLVDHGDAEVCKHDPGFEEDLIVETDARTFACWHLKRIEWAAAVRSGHIRIKGPRSLAHALPTWNRRGFEADEPVGYDPDDAGATTDRDGTVLSAGTDRRGAVPSRAHLAS